MANVFISWSGERSKKAAESLRDCLQSVVQAAEPWFSPDDIGKGKLWRGQIQEAFEAIKIAILVVTPDNKEKPWLLYEAGAFSAALGNEGLVMPYLVGLRPSDITSPLADLNVTLATQEDTLKMFTAVAASVSPKLAEATIAKALAREWSEFEARLLQLGTSDQTRTVGRSDREKLDEILSIVRGIAKDGGQQESLILRHLPSDFGERSIEELRQLLLTRRGSATRSKLVQQWLQGKELNGEEATMLWRVLRAVLPDEDAEGLWSSTIQRLVRPDPSFKPVTGGESKPSGG